MALGLALALVPGRVGAHGAPDPIEDAIKAVIAAEGRPDFIPFENPRLFSWRLFDEGRYMFTDEQRELSEAAHSFFEASDRMAGEDVDASLRLRARAQDLLYALLEQLPNVIPVDTSGEFAEMEYENLIEFTSDSGLVVFRINKGLGRPTFRTIPFSMTAINLEAVTEPQTFIDIPYDSENETWVLLRLRNAPRNPMAQMVRFVGQDGEKEHYGIFRVRTGPRGTLRFAIHGKGGKPTPAMVSIRHHATQVLHRPASAMEFAEQMDAIAGDPVPAASRPKTGYGEPYPNWTPGRTEGFYWCVPEPFEMMLPAGRYTVQVWKGIEFEPIVETFDIREGETTKYEKTIRRWVDMPARGWYSGDDHVHSRLMSDADAEKLKVYHEAADIHVGNIVEMGNYLRTYYEQRGYGPDYRVAWDDFVLVPGQEDPRYFSGHSLGINLGWQVRAMDKYLYNDWVADETHRSGGLYGHAHLIENMFNIRRDLVMLLAMGKSDFGEILQGNQLDTDLYYDFLNLGFPLTASAGSDVPYSHMLGEVRYFAYIGEDTPFSADDFFDAMGAGRTFVSNGPMLDLCIDEAFPGDRLEFDGPTRVRIRARAESIPDGEAGLKSMRIMMNGRAIVDVFEDALGVGEIVREFDFEINRSQWIALRAETHEGTEAHTTPVYIHVGGERFWEPEQVPGLLAMCRETLDGMQAELQRFLAQQEAGEIEPHNRFLPALLRMAPDLFKKIDHVRGIYDELEVEWVEQHGHRLGDLMEAARP